MRKVLSYAIVILLSMAVWTCAVFIGTVSGWFRKPITKENTIRSFVEATDQEIKKQFVGNFAMATFDKGIVEVEKFYSSGKPTSRHTVFQVASLSKWVSAFGVMKLVEIGKLDLDTPVSTYLTRWQLPPGEFNGDVTVRRLLSHTAGLTDGLGYSGFEKEEHIQPLEESLTKAADADAGASGIVAVGIEPGSAFKYSGGGYTLLQLLVEEVSQQSFDSFMTDSIFTPLGMTESTYVWNNSSQASLAEFYNTDSTRAKHYRYTAKAAASLYTTLADLEIFFQAHLEGKDGAPIGRSVLKSETVKMMRDPHGYEMGVPIWGLGTILYATTQSNDYVFGHDGKSTPPINTAMRINPETGEGIIILATGHPMIATRLASEWVFWKTGQVDTLLFPMLLDRMIWNIIVGWIVVIAGGIAFGLLTGKTRAHRGIAL